jgi:hypothetical protein
MELNEFKKRVALAFGPEMVHATPANVRDFIDTLQREVWESSRADQAAKTGNPFAPVDIDSTQSILSYEGTIRDFFNRMLQENSDQSMILVWMFALELAYSGIEEMHGESMNKLFVDDAA